MTEHGLVPATRLGLDRSSIIFLCTVASALGAGTGVALPFVLGWISGLAWIPLQGPLEWVRTVSDTGAGWALPIGGAVLGLAFMTYVIYDVPILHVGDDRIEVRRRDTLRRIGREQVVGIFRDGRKIVVEGAGGRTLFRGEVEGGRSAVRDAFVSHGYPWEAE